MRNVSNTFVLLLHCLQNSFLLEVFLLLFLEVTKGGGEKKKEKEHS